MHIRLITTRSADEPSQVVDIPTQENPERPRLTFDPEWLAITRAFHSHLAIERIQPRLPDAEQANDMTKKEYNWVLNNVGDKEKRDGIKDVSDCQTFWMTAPGPGNNINKFRQRQCSSAVRLRVSLLT